MVTKKKIKAKLNLIANLAEEAAKIRKSILKELGADSKDMRFLGFLDMIWNGACTADTHDFDKLIDSFGYEFAEDDEEEFVSYPIISINPYRPAMELLQEVPGGAFRIWTGIVDGDHQAGVIYRAKKHDSDGTCHEADLFYADVPHGAFAKKHGLSTDNEDVRVHVFGDAQTSDSTELFWIKHDDVLGTVSENDEGLKKPSQKQILDPDNIARAIEFILEAVDVGIMQADESQRYVYVATVLPDQAVIMQPMQIDAAARILLQNGFFDELKNAVEAKNMESN